MNEKQMARADFVTSIVWLVFGAYVTLVSWRMPRFEEQKVSIWSVPGLVTGLLGALFLLCGGIMFARSWRREKAKLSFSGAQAGRLLEDRAFRSILLAAGLCLAYGAGLVSRIPFLAASAIFVFSFIWLFEYRAAEDRAALAKRSGIAAVIAVVSAATITLVFEKLFLVTLP